MPEPMMDEDMNQPASAENTDNMQVQDKAKEKLKGYLIKAKPQDKLIINYLIGRCEADKGLADDVLISAKTYEKCFEYIKGKAMSHQKDGCAYIEDSVVYEWAEDYFHAEEKPKEKKVPNNTAVKDKDFEDWAKQKAKEAISDSENETDDEDQEEKIHKTSAKSKTAKSKPVTDKTQKTDKKTKSHELDGQMSLFDLM